MKCIFETSHCFDWVGMTVVVENVSFQIQFRRKAIYDEAGNRHYAYTLLKATHWAGFNIAARAQQVVEFMNAWSWPCPNSTDEVEEEEVPDEDEPDWYNDASENEYIDQQMMEGAK